MLCGSLCGYLRCVEKTIIWSDWFDFGYSSVCRLDQVLAATQTTGEGGLEWFQGTADAVRQYLWLFEVRVWWEGVGGRGLEFMSSKGKRLWT